MTLDLHGLNDNQRDAVIWDKGPLLVLAGPGSGKTRVLTLRIAKIIDDSPEKHFRVLGLTFTNKAASEMRNRVVELLPESQDRILLTTFHSFCGEVLRQHGNHVGIQSDFTILTELADRESYLLDAIKASDGYGDLLDDKDVKLLPLIEKAMESCASSETVQGMFKSEEVGIKVAMLTSAYKDLLIRDNKLDFPSLLFVTHELFSVKPAVANQIHITYPHICVDEFQDTNQAQFRILKTILGTAPKNLFVVADDDQIIYQWNGASPERLQELCAAYKMEVIQLPANYRCPSQVIQLANNLIRHNSDRSQDKQPLLAVKKTGNEDCIRLHRFSSHQEELAWVAQDILERAENDRSSCVLLARTKKLLVAAAEALNDAGLSAYMVIKKSEFVSTPLRWLHAAFRLANVRTDREQLRRLCKAFYGLEGLDIRVDDVVANASLHDGDYLRSWIDTVLERKELEDQTKQFLKQATKSLVERLDFVTFSTKAFAWFQFLEEQLNGREDDGFAEFTEEKAVWVDLQNTTFDKYGRDEVTLSVLLQELDLAPKTPPAPPDAIRCFTIHNSKGLEFPHVYLTGMAEDELPSYQSIKKGTKSREMQEERRNCFVAITRCQESLTLTHADNYFGWARQPSRFLKEMGLIKPKNALKKTEC